jgi:TM2 domain-containing membrane protein YozV/competence protein ComGC
MSAQPSRPRNQADTTIKKMCTSCFEAIHPKAEICPKCGVRQFTPINKTALVLLTFFLGGIGAHKFYLAKYWQGVLYLLFCWTAIPGLIAFVEFFIYIFTSKDRLQERYPKTHGGAAVACAVGAVAFIFIIGILAAIAIPQFVAYRSKAVCKQIEIQARTVSAAAAAYSASTGQQSAPTITQLIEAGMLSENPRFDIQILGDGHQLTVSVADPEGHCTKGASFNISIPDPMPADGWK